MGYYTHLLLKLKFLDLDLANTGSWILVLVILFFTFLIAFIFRKVMDKFFQLSSTYLHTDASKYKFLKHLISFSIVVVGIALAIYVIPSLRSLSISIFAGAGILAVILGFASQAAFSNIISGVFIVIFHPFRVNDRISIGERYRGVVEDITLRHVVIRDFQNKRIIIPNSIISNETITNDNLVDDLICRHIEFGISYDSNIDKAIGIIQDESMNHPSYIDNRTPVEKREGLPPVRVLVTGFGESSINLRAYVWSSDSAASWILFTDLNKSVKERFDREGIEIPFPYRTIVYKKDISEHQIKRSDES